MSPPSRRQFIRHLAGSLVALGSYPLTTIPAENNSFDTRIVDAGAIRTLASKLKGHLVTQGEPDYEAARLVFNRAFDRHPALIVYCASASDVARGLEFARNNNVPIAVRGGGHNRAGFSSCDNGVVLDLSRMNQVTVDAGKRIARADGGALTINLDAATQSVGLKMERAMGIEPTGKALPELENKRFGAMTDAKCD